MLYWRRRTTQRMKRSLFLRQGLALTALVSLFSLASCKDQAATPAPGGDAPAPVSKAPAGGGSSAFDVPRKPEGKLAVTLITNNSADFWTAAQKGLEAAQVELKDCETSRMAPGGSSPTHPDQKKTFEDAVAKNPDGIAVTPIDGKEFASVIDEAIDKKIPVICFDSDSETSKRLAYLGTNNYEAGKAAGEAALKLLPNGGKFVAFVGNMSAQNAIDRYKGFQDATKGKIEMLQEPFQDQADPLKAQRNVQDAITKYGNKINGFLGIWAYDGPAILNAVESAKLLGKVKIITFDGAPETLAGLQAKKVDAAVIQKPYEFGRLSAKLLYLINRKGVKAAIEELKPELEKAGMKVDGNKIDTGVTTVTPENVGPFVENMKKLGLKST